MQVPEYPLAQVESIKKKRLEEAEKQLQHKKQVLEEEEKKLKTLEEERDKVKAHKADKVKQMDDQFDEGITSDEIKVMERYIEVVDEKLKGKELKVDQQKGAVDSAKKAVEEARQLMVQKQVEVEKIKMHKEEWWKEMKMHMAREEDKMMDEIGSASFIRNKNRSKNK